MSKPISVLIVDDEKPARDKLLYLLAKDPLFTVAGTAEDGNTALSLMHSLNPDVMFLDIQMPDPDGIEVALQCTESKPVIVFTTAYNEYAVKAFELASLDYLLKPFDSLRFAVTLERIKKHFSMQEAYNTESAIQQAASAIKNEQHPGKQAITVKHGDKFIIVPMSEIVYFSADGNYITLHTRQSKYLLRKTFHELTAELENTRFVRVQRSYIVNKDEVKEIHPQFNGDYVIYLKDGRKVPCSRSYRESLKMHFQM